MDFCMTFVSEVKVHSFKPHSIIPLSTAEPLVYLPMHSDITGNLGEGTGLISISHIQPTRYLPWYRTHTIWAISSPLGEYSAHVTQVLVWKQLEPLSRNSHTPGTHRCWVGSGSTEWEVCLTLLHMTRSWISNPRSFDLESNALSTWQHALIKVEEIRCLR